MKVVIILLKKIEKVKDFSFIRKGPFYRDIFNQIQGYPAPPLDACLSFVLLFTIFIIIVTQKLVLQQSKNVTAKCTETLSPPPLFNISLHCTMHVWIQTFKTPRLSLNLFMKQIALNRKSKFFLVKLWSQNHSFLEQRPK